MIKFYGGHRSRGVEKVTELRHKSEKPKNHVFMWLPEGCGDQPAFEMPGERYQRTCVDWEHDKTREQIFPGLLCVREKNYGIKESSLKIAKMRKPWAT